MKVRRRTLVSLVATTALGAGVFFGWRALARAQNDDRWMLGRDCPLGRDSAEAESPDGKERWCGTKSDGGGFVRHGRYRAWYPTGQLKTEGWYVQGKKHRPWHWFTATGKPGPRGKYSHDRKDGFWMTCSDAGAPVSLQVYDLGQEGERLDAVALAGRAAKAGPEDIGHFRWGHEKIAAWCSGAARP